MKISQVVVALLFSATAFAQDITLECLDGDVVASIPDDSQFSVLKAAIEYTGLDVGALIGDQPFTILAPNDDAFVALLGALGVESLSEISPMLVAQVLLNHVILGTAVPASAIIEAGGIDDVVSTLEDLINTDAAALEGDVKVLVESVQEDCTSGLLDADLEDGAVVFSTDASEAVVVTPDIMVCSGIVHEIDAVLIPSCTIGDDDILTTPTPPPAPMATPPVYGMY